MKTKQLTISDFDMSWIERQLEAGESKESLVEPLCQVGWGRALVHRTLGLPEIDEPEPVKRPVPAPTLDEGVNTIDVGDRNVDVLLSMAQPHIVLFGNVLSDYECDRLIEYAKLRGLEPSVVVTSEDNKMVTADYRTSEGVFFESNETELIGTIERRISKLVNWPVTHCESLHVLHYGLNGEYRTHHDYFTKDRPLYRSVTEKGGNRIATLIMYLSETPAGGGTEFSDVEMTFHPHKGQALLFTYGSLDHSSQTMHAGLPVLKGEKWIMTRWFREGEFSI